MALGTMTIPAYAAEEVKSVYVPSRSDDDQTFKVLGRGGWYGTNGDSGRHYVDEYDIQKFLRRRHLYTSQSPS